MRGANGPAAEGGSKRRRRDRAALSAVTLLSACLVRGLCGTMRFSETGRTGFSPIDRSSRPGKPVIFAFWHSRLLPSTCFFRDRGIQVLVSRSNDGEIMARVLEKFGYGAIRGSASRGGLDALREMARALKQGLDVAITPDGPRGPREVVQEGIIYLARITGAPIAPFSFQADRVRRLNSWDRFVLPMPFSRGVFIWGEPVVVPERSDKGLIEEKRMELEAELKRITAIVEGEWGRPRSAGEFPARHEGPPPPSQTSSPG